MYHSSNVRRGPGSIELPRSRTTITEQELLEHVALTIPERAAIPKRIKISPWRCQSKFSGCPGCVSLGA